jgi:hypothetical protein
MRRKEALQQLNLGNSVAEFDDDLKNYFVETETFRLLILGSKDIVAGDKGTSKTALFRILRERYKEIPQLANVEIVPAFNTSGSPVFQQLAEGMVFSEGQYRTIWKTYVLSLAGNWLLKKYEGRWTPSMSSLNDLLTKVDVRELDETPASVFSRIVGLARRLTTPKSMEAAVSFNEAGLPVVTPKIEFETEAPDIPKSIIRHAESLGLLNRVLKEADLHLWLVLDRLDEAFTGYPTTEIPALRALFRTYLDLLEFDRIRLKMFVRKDLFRKITQGGFVNLSHINDRKVEIVWNDNDLFNLLIGRIRTNKLFMRTAKLVRKTNGEIFNALFPLKVEEGAKRPGTLKWMLTRVSDGQGVKPPRNLIDLVKKAQEEQFRIEDRAPQNFEPGTPLIVGEAIKAALNRLSTQRVEDTLLAESGDYKENIEKFRDGKAEHNLESLQRVLSLPLTETKEVLRVLLDMGFLERQGETYKVPILYRDGLNITQGKAFQSAQGTDSDSDGEDT